MSGWKSCSLTSLHHTGQLLAQVRAAGRDPLTALEGSEITAGMLSDLSRKIKIVDEYVVYRNVNAMFPERNITLEIGLNARVSVYGLLGYALLTANTLRDALSVAAEFPALIANGFNLSLEEYEGKARLVFSGYSGATDLKTAYAELAVSSFTRSCSDILGRDLPLAEVTFEGAVLSSHATRCEHALGCTVVYHQPRNMMVFDAALLDELLPLRDAVSHLEVTDACRRQNREYAAEREWLHKVKVILEKDLQNPRPLEEVAHHMHCSARTLRRQLGVFKTSYRQILDEVRFEKAKLMLKEGKLHTDQIAERLGFCDGAGFRRAFQRWSGLAPGAYKA
ncbi:AraC family transcriptional regulator [Pseudomonas sp. 02C 26]|uniref:AraC family transcriptional regulator n=1 Tax=Pseudomonas sp. 02C 26 TaxID=2054914 RepID=UPI000C6E2AB4|nr:AraC family transcriptional regulator [Pseudomonas sp. 02C 26]AUF96857.1 AraC family transcriptional regulator [Pseudomonas sp. 02C 26]